MLSTVAALTGTVCLWMHMKGTPQTMQQQAEYKNVTREVLDFLLGKRTNAKLRGITDVIIDPGFGFAKAIAHNFRVLKELSVFKMLDAPC